jgi:hypothetical protein
MNRESLYPNFNRKAELYVFIQKAIAIKRRSNISLESQLEVLVTDSEYAFSRGRVVVIVTNTNAQRSVQLPVTPFAIGDTVCDVMQETSQCTTVSASGYSFMMTGEPKVVMHAADA